MQPSVWAEARLFTSRSNGLEGMESRGKSRKAPGSGTPGDKGTKKRKLCGLPLLLHSNLNISNESVDKDTTSDRQSQAFRELF